MQIKAPLFATIYCLIVSLLAFYTVYAVLSSCGLSGLRLLSFWIMLIAGLYFLISGLHTFFTRTRPETPVFCPVIQGALIVFSFILFLGWISNLVFNFQFFTIAGPESFLIYLLLPCLFLGDWLLFSPKGAWTASYPLYWLALLAAYASVIILTSPFISQNSPLRFPYWFLNYPDSGIDTLLCWFALIASLTLVFGYTLWVIDFALSGELARHIVLPRIKTIVIEEELDEPQFHSVSQKSVSRLIQPLQSSKIPTAVRNQSQRKSQPDKVEAASSPRRAKSEFQPQPSQIGAATPKSSSRSSKAAQSKNHQSQSTRESQKTALNSQKSPAKPLKSQNSNVSSTQPAKSPTPPTITNSKDQKSAKNIHGSSHKSSDSENHGHDSVKNPLQPAMNSPKSSGSQTAATPQENPSRLGKPAHRSSDSYSELPRSDSGVSAPKPANPEKSEPKSSDLKVSDAKSADSKTSASKTPNPQTPASKQQNSNIPKPTPPDLKDSEPKTNSKSTESKSPEPKISHFHSSDPNSSASKTSDSKSPKSV